MTDRVRVPLADSDIEPGAVALRVPHAARVFDVSERQVWKWIADGAVPAYRHGRVSLVFVADLEAFLRDATPVPVTRKRGKAARRRST